MTQSRSTRNHRPEELAYRPLYAQIKERLVQRLSVGEWMPGQQLPSETALAAEYGVSQGTLRKALDVLAAERLVIRRQGRGTVVARHDSERALFQFFHVYALNGERQLPDSRVLARDRGRATRGEAEALALPPRAPVIRIRRVRFLVQRPAMVEIIVLPQQRFPDLDSEAELPNALYALYQSRYGITIARASERLRAVAATDEDARHLELPPGTPLLEIERLAMDIERTPIEWRCSRLDTTDHYYFNELD